MMGACDAVIVGSGPNGMAAAITLLRAGRSVTVIEAESEVGGGARSGELTLPGFTHDLFSAVHPLALESDFFQALPLEEHGLSWIHSPAALAHPLDDGSAVLLHRSTRQTAEQLGRDKDAYERLFGGLLQDWDYLKSEVLRPLRFPSHPFRFAKFGLPALMPATLLARTYFREDRARALFAGTAAHSTLPLQSLASSAFGLTLLLAGHHVGWPFPRGGAQSISKALHAYVLSLGGTVITGQRVARLSELPEARSVFLDLTPRQVVTLAGKALAPSFRRRLSRYRYGPGVFKLDWALDGPIPWKAPETAQAATVHVGGALQEIAASEQKAWAGRTAERPFVLLAQPSLFDATRAPAGKHTAWGYCHVPNGSTEDMTERIEGQIERFAPGFRDRILARNIFSPVELERRNANLVGGDINGGAVDLSQLFLRPTARLYSTSNQTIFICSSSTPPGGGVHGMCGYHAAREALDGYLK